MASLYMNMSGSNNSPKILDELLGYDGDIRLLNGEPFSGVGYSEYDNNQLEKENTYVNGLPEGLQRTWYRNGQLKTESLAIRGLGSNKVTTWYECGQIKSIILYDAGIKIHCKDWDKNGNLLKDEAIKISPALKTYIDRIKKIKNC